VGTGFRKRSCSKKKDRENEPLADIPRLSTHVLDTAAGRAAAGVRVVLWRLDDGKAPVAEGVTNADGRLDRPLLEGAAFALGTYRLDFHVGDYFRANGVAPADPPFLDVIPIRFGIAERAHYHVPLLVAPYGYSTYRGS
jgi:5-hydroxyisourate hydrolase